MVNGTVVFAPGETSKTILIQTLDDGILEPNSSFTVSLSNPAGATLARSQGTGTIVENDPSLSVVSAPSSVPAGSPFGPTVHADDSSGNLESSFDGTVTVALANNPGGGTLGGTLSVRASGGVAVFSGLKLTAAASGYTLQVSTSGFNGATTSGITVIPAVASQLLIRTQPSSTATAGQAFGTQPVVVEEDRYGNIETTDNSTIVRAALSSGSGPLEGATATVAGGVATFTGLADNTAETLSLKFNSGGLSGAATSPIAVTATPPTIQLEQVLTTQKTNKKGKPVGKPVFVGFALDYSTAMNPSTAGLAANYQVSSAVTKRVKKKTITVLQPVKFTAAYNPSTNSVNLTIIGKQKFAKGGQIRVNASPSSGVSSAGSVLLDANDTSFTTLANAKGITPG
ncbi:MAG: Calx-beta domain-containing protein [Isosphaerales bacterium]